MHGCPLASGGKRATVHDHRRVWWCMITKAGAAFVAGPAVPCHRTAHTSRDSKIDRKPVHMLVDVVCFTARRHSVNEAGDPLMIAMKSPRVTALRFRKRHLVGTFAAALAALLSLTSAAATAAPT